MEITLEQIDLIRQRTGAGYKEARQALERAGGSLVDALVMLEGNGDSLTREQAGLDDGPGNFQYSERAPEKQGRKRDRVMQNKIVTGLVDLSRRSKIRITLPGERQVEIPAVLGVAGVVLAPKVAALSGMALLLAKSSLTVDYSAGSGQGREESPEETS